MKIVWNHLERRVRMEVHEGKLLPNLNFITNKDRRNLPKTQDQIDELDEDFGDNYR